MIKNTSGQIIGAQMITAADGTAFTGSVTIYVTGDGGTQAVGSVGSGACTHEGNGFHSYAPAQAETNYDHVAYTFIGTGALPATIQVYTKAGDAFTRLGAPAGASIAADIAAIDTVVDTILVDTNELQTNQGDWATATGFSTFNPASDTVANVTLVGTCTTNTDMRGTDNALLAASYTAPDNSSISAILTDTGTTIPAQISSLNNISAADVNAQVDTALADYDAPTKAEMDSAFTEIKGATFSGTTDSLEAIRDRGDAAWTTGAGGSAPTVEEIRAEIDANSTQLAAIVADTNELQTNQGDWVTATGFSTFDANTDVVEANIKYVNDIEVTGNGEDATPWNPV